MHPVKCSVSSQDHEKELYIQRLKSPNCRRKNHIWNPRCFERLQRLPGGGKLPLHSHMDHHHNKHTRGDKRQPQFVPAPPFTCPVWAVESQTRKLIINLTSATLSSQEMKKLYYQDSLRDIHLNPSISTGHSTVCARSFYLHLLSSSCLSTHMGQPDKRTPPSPPPQPTSVAHLDTAA